LHFLTDFPIQFFEFRTYSVDICADITVADFPGILILLGFATSMQIEKITRVKYLVWRMFPQTLEVFG
jgi:hypothetical protein